MPDIEKLNAAVANTDLGAEKEEHYEISPDMFAGLGIEDSENTDITLAQDMSGFAAGFPADWEPHPPTDIAKFVDKKGKR